MNPCSRSLAGTTRRLLRISSVSVRMKIAPISSIHSRAGRPNGTPYASRSWRMNSAFGSGFGDATFTTPSMSLDVLQPHRVALRALIPVLVGDPDDGVFAAGTAFSRQRVQRAFEDAVAGSTDAPKPPLAAALGRLLYLVHLAVLLWWLLDKSPKQRTTAALVAVTRQLLPSAALTLRLPPIRRFLMAMDDLIREGLFGSPAEA